MVDIVMSKLSILLQENPQEIICRLLPSTGFLFIFFFCFFDVNNFWIYIAIANCLYFKEI